MLTDQVGPHHGVGGEEHQQVRQVAAASCDEEGIDDMAALVTRRLHCHRLGPSLHLAPRPARQLAYGDAGSPEDGADLVEGIPEDVVEHERRSLGRDQVVEDDLDRPARPLGQERVRFRVDRRDLGGNLGFGIRPGPSLAQVVQAQPRHDGRQPRGQVVDVAGPGKPQPGLLKHVIRIGVGSEYPAGDRDQAGPLGVEVGHVHAGHILQHVQGGHMLLTCADPEM